MAGKDFNLFLGYLLNFSFVVLGEVAVEETHARLSDVVVDGVNHFFELSSKEVAAINKHIFPQLIEGVLDVLILLHFRWESVHPAFNERL